MPTATSATSRIPPRIHRFEVSPRPGHADPIGRSVLHDAEAIGIPLKDARATRIYLIQAPLADAQADLLRERFLADPVVEQARVGASPPAPRSQVVEVHPLPGVMDPVAQSVAAAVRELL